MYRQRTWRPSANKFRAVKCEYDGYIYDSKFEASVAIDLDLRLKAGEILGWERQFLVEIIPYDSIGNPVPKLKVSHKIDFRVHEVNGTFTLLEAKGVETSDWRRRRRWLEELWLPDHPDHQYVVVKQGKMWKRKAMK